MNSTIDKSKRIKIASIILAFLGNVIFFLTVWLLNQYDHVRIDQFLFQLKSNSEGVHSEIALNAVLLVGGLGISVTLLEIMLYRILSGNVKGKLRECFLKHKKYINYCAGKFCDFCNRKSFFGSSFYWKSIN